MTSPGPMTSPAEQPRCGAPKSRGRGSCRSTYLFANGRCRVHGGGAARGPAHPNFTTGYRSKSLPVRLAARYEQARLDPDLISLRDDVALMDARIGDLLTQLSTGGTAKAVKALRVAYLAFQTARQAADEAAMARPLAAWDRLTQDAVDEMATWREILQALDLRRKLVDSEANRLKDMRQLMTTEMVLTYTAALVASVRKYVTDPVALAGIAAEVQKLVGDGRSVA